MLYFYPLWWNESMDNDIMNLTFNDNPVGASEYCKNHFSATVASTIATADDVLNNKFIFCRHWDMERCITPVIFPEGEIDWTFILNEDPEWMYQLHRHGYLFDLAKAFIYTKETKYRDKFESLIQDWITNTILSPDTEANTWRSLEAGLRCCVWIKCLEIFKTEDALSQKTLEMMNLSMVEHGEYLVRKQGVFHLLSNWGVLQDEGLFSLGCYLGRPQWCQLAVTRLTRNAHLQIMNDGSHWEQSPMYHGEVLHCFLNVILIAKHYGYTLPALITSKVHNMVTAVAYWTKPDGVFFCQSDTDDIHSGDLIVTGAILFNDGKLKSFAHSEVYEENIWDFTSEERLAYKNMPTEEIPISTALYDSGNYMLRSGLDRSSNCLHFHCGCMGSGHGHADLLHIGIASNGEEVLTNTGRLTYKNTPERLYLKSAMAHNTTAVDNISFSKPMDTWGYETLAQPVKGNYNFTKDYDYVYGGHLGYMSPVSNVYTQRKVLHIKPDIYVIVDEFYTNESHEYSQFFHFGYTGTTTLVDNVMHFDGKHTKAKLISLHNDSVTLAPCTVSPRYNELEDSMRGVITRKGNGFTTMITVIGVGMDADTLTATLAPVSYMMKETTLTTDKAEGLVIGYQGKEYTVIIGHGEAIAQVDLLVCNEHFGYGQALVFDETNPDGICLAW